MDKVEDIGWETLFKAVVLSSTRKGQPLVVRQEDIDQVLSTDLQYVDHMSFDYGEYLFKFKENRNA